MHVLVFAESNDGKVKKTSHEAIAYAAALGGSVTALAIGRVEAEELSALGKFGASKVLHADDDRLHQEVIQAYAHVITQAMQHTGADVLVLYNSTLGTPIAAQVAAAIAASLATNVVAPPDTTSGFSVKRGIYSGKAYCWVELTKPKKVIAIRKNAAEAAGDGGNATVEAFTPEIRDEDFRIKVTGTEKATGEVLLPEAEIIVSGGRGMKGPEHWGILEALARELGAATGCSKPVSDMGWRPHHEHVGQTGVKVSPQLYIAVGISGAIQH